MYRKPIRFQFITPISMPYIVWSLSKNYNYWILTFEIIINHSYLIAIHSSGQAMLPPQVQYPLGTTWPHPYIDYNNKTCLQNTNSHSGTDSPHWLCRLLHKLLYPKILWVLPDNNIKHSTILNKPINAPRLAAPFEGRRKGERLPDH